ncbi:type IV pilus biogenesis/stability protein PilW [Luteimonas pelagia]
MRQPDGRVRWFLVAAVLMAAAGCSKLTFVKPDMSRGDYRQVAPRVEVSDKGRRSPLAARDELLLARQRLGEGETAQARRHAEAALGHDPDSEAAHTMLALVAQAEGDVATAGRHYQRAAELAPGQGYTLNNYGTWLCLEGRHAESLGWFDRALATPGYASPASALANAGACAARAGQDARAARDLRRALELDPGNAVALAALAEVSYRAGRMLDARAFVERRLAAAPADASVLRLASQIEEKLGDMDAASRYTRRLRAEFGEGASPAPGE